MVRLKVSYDHMDELIQLQQLLGCTIKNVKRSPQRGGHKRAYIDLIDLEGVEISETPDCPELEKKA